MLSQYTLSKCLTDVRGFKLEIFVLLAYKTRKFSNLESGSRLLTLVFEMSSLSNFFVSESAELLQK